MASRRRTISTLPATKGDIAFIMATVEEVMRALAETTRQLVELRVEHDVKAGEINAKQQELLAELKKITEKEVIKPADEKEPLAPAESTTESKGTASLSGTLQGSGTPPGKL